MISVKDLHYLVVLSQTGHYGKAAAICHVSQPTLSGQIKKLEQRLGARLVEASKPKLLLTPLGEQVVAKAKPVLAQVADIESLATQHQDPYSGKLTLALIPSVAAYILPFLTQQVRSQLPNLRIELVELQTHKLLQQLQAGTVDAGLLALPKPQPGLRSLNMWVEEFVLALPVQHEWVGRQHVDSQEIVHQRLLILEDGHCLADQTKRLCGLSDGNKQFKGTSLETLRHMVRMGYGVTLVPKLTQLLWQEQGEAGIVFIPINNPVPGRQLGIMGRTGGAHWPVIERLNRLVQAALPQPAEAATVIGFD
ncbi:MAG TPA: DNA-binding transcriptional regulator OxyR [Oceanospirillaceae bacterium]|nr:DNA-binding transcriptional regulator OxyR [Oceanospirillaceae bacterium]